MSKSRNVCLTLKTPHINELDVFNQIKKAKKPKSEVPGDLPRTLMQEFAPELAGTLSGIYRTLVNGPLLGIMNMEFHFRKPQN